jgi:hypothetical protein
MGEEGVMEGVMMMKDMEEEGMEEEDMEVDRKVKP